MDTQPASHVAVAYIPSLLRRTGKNGYGLFIFITYANKKWVADSNNKTVFY